MLTTWDGVELTTWVMDSAVWDLLNSQTTLCEDNVTTVVTVVVPVGYMVTLPNSLVWDLFSVGSASGSSVWWRVIFGAASQAYVCCDACF